MNEGKFSAFFSLINKLSVHLFFYSSLKIQLTFFKNKIKTFYLAVFNGEEKTVSETKHDQETNVWKII